MDNRDYDGLRKVNDHERSAIRSMFKMYKRRVDKAFLGYAD